MWRLSLVITESSYRKPLLDHWEVAGSDSKEGATYKDSPSLSFEHKLRASARAQLQMLCCHSQFALTEQTVFSLLSFTSAREALASGERIAQSQDHRWLHFAVMTTKSMEVKLDDQALRCESHDGQQVKQVRWKKVHLGQPAFSSHLK